jgi:hypothetical protein
MRRPKNVLVRDVTRDVVKSPLVHVINDAVESLRSSPCHLLATSRTTVHIHGTNKSMQHKSPPSPKTVSNSKTNTSYLVWLVAACIYVRIHINVFNIPFRCPQDKSRRRPIVMVPVGTWHVLDKFPLFEICFHVPLYSVRIKLSENSIGVVDIIAVMFAWR